MPDARPAASFSRSLSAIVLAVTACAVPRAGFAQLSTVRGMFALTADSVDATRLFSRAQVFASLDLATHRASGVESSSYRVGVLIDVIPLGHGITLGGLLGTELKVNPDNALGFNPRGIIWEEEAGLHGRAGNVRWRGAWFMRCRHDVDNGTPENPLDSVQYVVARGRVIVLQGVRAGVESGELALSRRVTLRVGGNLDAYSKREDRRTPKGGAGPEWSRARGAIEMSARTSVALANRVAVYGRAWESLVLFGSAPASSGSAAGSGQQVKGNTRIEVGSRMRGMAGGVDLFLAREFTFDDLMGLEARRATTTTLGVRLHGADLF